MEDIRKNILEKGAARKLNILKGFIESDEVHGDIEKARSGTYADNAENRKLNRVGQKYGSEKKEENDEGKSEPPKTEENSKEGKKVWNELNTHAENTSSEDLKTFLNKYGNDPSKMEEVEAAKMELRERGESESNEENSDYKESNTDSDEGESDIDSKVEEAKQKNEDSKNLELFKESVKNLDFSDSESVKNFLNENKDFKKEYIEALSEDIFTEPIDIIKDLIKQKTGETDSTDEEDFPSEGYVDEASLEELHQIINDQGLDIGNLPKEQIRNKLKKHFGY